MNNAGITEKNNYRYERKFFISGLTKYEVESIVKLHPSMFSEIYPPRFVNNIYFDSFNLQNFADNTDGPAQKLKFRIRWYGGLFGRIEKANLEIKIKKGLLSRKEIFLLQPFEISNSSDFRDIVGIVHDSDIPEILKMKIKTLMPSLLNRYLRRYYRSTNKCFRITVDTDQVFYSIYNYKNLFMHKYTDDINIILELKYDSCLDGAADRITNHFPFRITRSSKYVRGIEKLYIE